MAPSTPPRSITHIGLTVPDIEKAIEWYEAVLGFTLLKGPDTIRGRDADIAKEIVGDFDVMKLAHMSSGNQVGLELFEYGSTSGQTETDYLPPGLHHFCIIDPEIEELIERIEENSGEQHSAIHRLYSEQDYRFAYCRDPFGNYIEIYSHSYEQFMANKE